MHFIPETFREKRFRIQARLDPNQLEDLDFDLLNLPFANTKRLERFQYQSELAYLKIEEKFQQRFQDFEEAHPVWSQENQRQADLLLEDQNEKLQDISDKLWHLDNNLEDIIQSLPGDQNNYNLSDYNQVLDFLSAKRQFEPIVRSFERGRAAALREYFEDFNIPITNLDIGLGVYWRD